MPDVLLYDRDPSTLTELERLFKENKFRVKTTLEYSTVQEWLSSKKFDLFCLGETELDLENFKELSKTLWEKNPEAPFMLYSEQSALTEELVCDLLLLGIDVVPVSELKSVIANLAKNFEQTESSQSILVVEDLDSPRDIICAFIEHIGGFSVLGVSSASQALQELQDNPSKFFCMVTDINMPKFNGKELIKAVRSNSLTSNLPIIALTAYGTPECLVDCMAAGASGFLVKPPKRVDFTRELGRALRINHFKLPARLVRPDQVDCLRETLELGASIKGNSNE